MSLIKKIIICRIFFFLYYSLETYKNQSVKTCPQSTSRAQAKLIHFKLKRKGLTDHHNIESYAAIIKTK